MGNEAKRSAHVVAVVSQMTVSAVSIAFELQDFVVSVDVVQTWFGIDALVNFG